MQERALAAKDEKNCGDISNPFGDESPPTKTVGIIEAQVIRMKGHVCG